jgi:hypothetical protein
VYLGAAWCPASLDAPLSAARVRRIRERSGGRVVLAVDGDLLVYRFPYSHRDRMKRGQVNPGFLDPEARVRLAELWSGGDAVDVVVLRLRGSPRTRMPERLVTAVSVADALPPALCARTFASSPAT